MVQPVLAKGVEEGDFGRRIGDQVESIPRVLAHGSRASTAAQTRAATVS